MNTLFRKLFAGTGAVLCAIGLTACSGTGSGVHKESVSESVSPSSQHTLPSPQSIASGRELMCLAKSQEEAESIASCYNIELLDFSHGVAVFHTEEDPYEVVRRGKENGWVLLSVNTRIKLTD